DSEWEYGHGPQGDIIHINNFVRLVRENPLSTYNFEDDDSEDDDSEDTGDINGDPQSISSYPLYLTILITITAFAVLVRRKNKNLGNGSD
ncbi:hypothetical protein LCGC14_2146200, partial [marine sediment metagenome]